MARSEDREEGKEVFWAGPSLPCHNKNPSSLAHPLFKLPGPSSLLVAGEGRGMCVLGAELSAPIYRWRNGGRERGRPQSERAEGRVLAAGQRLYLQHKVHALCMNNGDVHREVST